MCHGSGRIASKAVLLNSIERWLKNFRVKSKEFRLILYVHPHVAAYLAEGALSKLSRLMIKYFVKILISMIPVLVVGVFFQDKVEALFTGKLILVGAALLVTALLLFLTTLVKAEGTKKIPFSDAFVMGIAQAMAVIPGLSRSGSTIATGLLLKNKRTSIMM